MLAARPWKPSCCCRCPDVQVDSDFFCIWLAWLASRLMVPLLLLLLPFVVDYANVYPQMSTGLLVPVLHNISAVQYHKVWKKTFPFLKEIEENISFS